MDGIVVRELRYFLGISSSPRSQEEIALNSPTRISQHDSRTILYAEFDTSLPNNGSRKLRRSLKRRTRSSTSQTSEVRCNAQCCAQGQISSLKSPRSPNSPPIRRQFRNRRQKEASDISTAPAISLLPLMEIVDRSWRAVTQTGEQGSKQARVQTSGKTKVQSFLLKI